METFKIYLSEGKTNMTDSQDILIIGSVWPEPTSSAAGSRIMQLITLFRDKKWKISFASAAAESEYSADLKSLNIEKFNIAINDSGFDALIKKIQPTIVLFDRFMTEEQFGWRVAENCPGAMRILDTEDLHCLRYGRQHAWKEKKEFLPEDLLNDFAKREIASIYRCDLSLIISSYEMELLKTFFKVDVSLLHYLPFLLDAVDNNVERWKTFYERENFVAIGNFLHAPNWNSVQYLKEEIWPLIRKQLPEAELNVYGAYPSQKVIALNNPKEGFLVKGRVENAYEVICKAKVLLAPLRFGAGLKGKLIDAMQTGTPSVTTSIGAEAMHAGLQWSGSIEDNPEDFANVAVQLFHDKKRWEESQSQGAIIINSCYSKKLLGKQVLERILEIQGHLKKHRSNNFTGEMLMHHTIAGTKYMSKWIEEKNKG